MNKSKILIIIPAYNEEQSLLALLREIQQLGYDMVVINDASIDATEQVAKQVGVTVLSLAANLGIGGAVQTGFKFAKEKGYDIVVQIDGDGQHNPTWIETVVKPLHENKADCVIGSRYFPGHFDTAYKTPILRRLGMHFSTGILRLATGMLISDTTSGFRALNRKAFTYFAQHYPVDHPEAEALLMLHHHGFRILEVPITMRGRIHGQSLFNFTRALLYPLRVIIGFTGILLKKKQPI